MIYTATLLLELGLATRTKQSMFDARWEGQRPRRRRRRRRWRRATEFCFSKTKDASKIFWWKSNLGSRKVQRFIWQSKKNWSAFLSHLIKKLSDRSRKNLFCAKLKVFVESWHQSKSKWSFVIESPASNVFKLVLLEWWVLERKHLVENWSNFALFLILARPWALFFYLKTGTLPHCTTDD